MEAPTRLASKRMSLFRSISRLTPSALAGCTYGRFGRWEDGGYVLADDVENLSSIVSYGIDHECSFEFALANRGKQIFMFDHTVDDAPMPHANFHFYKEGVAPERDCDKLLDSIEGHLRRLNLDDDRLLLKIDVEGAEFDVLSAIEPSILQRFRQIVIEIHWLQKLNEDLYRAGFDKMMANLLDSHTVIHAHGNNCAPLVLVEGFVVPAVIELTLVRTCDYTLVPNDRTFPTDLDAPNNRAELDHCLFFYPFDAGTPGAATGRSALRSEIATSA